MSLQKVWSDQQAWRVRQRYSVVNDENSLVLCAIDNIIASDMSGLRARPFSANNLRSSVKQSSKLQVAVASESLNTTTCSCVFLAYCCSVTPYASATFTIGDVQTVNKIGPRTEKWYFTIARCWLRSYWPILMNPFQCCIINSKCIREPLHQSWIDKHNKCLWYVKFDENGCFSTIHCPVCSIRCPQQWCFGRIVLA